MWYPRLSSRIRTSSAWVLAPAVLMAAAASCDRQAPAGLEEGLEPLFKPGGGDIIVSSVDPPEAEQGVTLDVAVLGRNFPRGDVDSCTDPVTEGCTWAELGIDEVVTEKVKTNRSTWVSSRKLIANITIDPEAIPDLYDAIVSLRGSRGVGTEKFQVKVKPQQDIPLTISFQDGTSDGVRSDGSGIYINEIEGIEAVIVPGGELWFSARNSTSRSVQVHLGSPIAGFPFDPDRMPTGDPAAGVQAWIVTQDFDGPGFHGPTPRMPFYVTWNAEGKSWSLNFGSYCEDPNGVHNQPDDFVHVAPTASGWTVEAAARAEGSAWFCAGGGRGKNRGWVTIGRFDTPLLMTLDRLGD